MPFAGLAFAAALPLLQAAPAVAPAPAAPAAAPGLEERVVALVQAGKCGRAKDEAVKGGDASLAEQVGAMCGARSSGVSGNSGGKGSGGGGRGGGASRGGGSRGGGPGG